MHMPQRSRTLAERAAGGERAVLEAIARAPLRVRADNLVARPWGGTRLVPYKGIVLDAVRAGMRYGEAFEISADPTDAEAAAYPSVVVLEDGSEVPLCVLLERAGELFLGARVLAAHGPRLPLLPKTLDVAELLSVQAHPAGLPELYVVLEAEPGATLRVGFARDVDPALLVARWRAGRRAQEELLGLVREDAVDALAAASRAFRVGASEQARAALEPALRPGVARRDLDARVETLATVCRETLDALRALEVRAGDVILNARPETRSTARPSADVHALGDPEGRAILLLEVRRPGPTLRAWDHARFPLRRLDVAEAIAAAPPRATSPDAYRVAPQPVAGHPGVTRAVACEAFTVELVEPPRGEAALLPGVEGPRTLHVVEGVLSLHGAGGRALGSMRAGQSTFVPAALALALGGEGRAVVASLG